MPRLAAVLAVAALLGHLAADWTTAAPAACSAPASRGLGYAYAGHQATRKGHGVRATIAVVHSPVVRAGHIAGWVGVGGPGQGPGGEDMWIQAGLASRPGEGIFLYAESVGSGGATRVRRIEGGLRPGETRRIAVLEMSRRPGHWRVWVDGVPVIEPIALRGSSGRWAPIATAESWNGGRALCNRFAVRFEEVSVALERGGSWAPFEPGHRFHDRGYRLSSRASAGEAFSFVAAFA